MIHTHYDNLKVSRTAPLEVIEAAYKSLVQKYHPDLNQGDVEATRIMKIINEAYDVLSDPVKKAEHDLWIKRNENIEISKIKNPDLPKESNNHAKVVSKKKPYKKSIVSETINDFFDGLKELLKLFGIGAFCIAVAVVIAMLVSKEDDLDTKSSSHANSNQSNSYNDNHLELKALPDTGYTDNAYIGGVAPLTIKVQNSAHYWVKIDNAYTGEHLVSHFIRSGDTLSVNLPLGNYTIKYAYGQQWYGEEYLFGGSTGYAQADKVFNFQSNGNRYNGYTVELITQPYGNLSTSNINKSNF
jgi:hypothetical protein